MKTKFWVYLNGGWTRLSISPGQNRHTHTSRKTDEGWTSDSKEWVHEGDHIIYRRMQAGRDCDGYGYQVDEMTCPVPLVFEANEHSPSGQVPAWKPLKTRCYDQFAEMSGY